MTWISPSCRMATTGTSPSILVDGKVLLDLQIVTARLHQMRDRFGVVGAARQAEHQMTPSSPPALLQPGLRAATPDIPGDRGSQAMPRNSLPPLFGRRR